MMKESPLVVPIWIDPDLPTSPSKPLPIQPDHVACWTSTSEGSIRHVALSAHNSLYIHSTFVGSAASASAMLSPPTQNLPIIKTPPTLSSSQRRPVIGRTHSAPRSRADSIASSVKTSSSHRRVSAFSPPPSAKIPSAVLTSATASAVTHDAGPSHARGKSADQDKSELRDHLREQRDRDFNDEKGIGLGIALGRRSIHVHSKDEIESTGSTSPTGPGHSGKARSTASFDSSRTERTGGLRGWLRGDQDGKQEREKEMREQLEEVEVEREMEREREEERREAQEKKAMESVEDSTPNIGFKAELEKDGADTTRLRRIVLGQPARGKIVSLQVFKSAGVLAVLRDIGILDLISLDTLQVVDSVLLEQPEPKQGEAGSSKSALRLVPFWSWRSIHLAQSGSTRMIIAEGIPWPCAMPSPNGEVTRVVMITTIRERWSIATGLELPGTGNIGVCNGGDTSYLLHFLPHSLTSYSITFPSVSTRSAAPSPSNRAVSSVHASPYPNSNTTSDAEKSLRRNRSLQSLHEESKEKETGFAKFLAARRAPNAQKEVAEDQKAGLGEGKEVERDGYGAWNAVKMSESGDGLGIGQESIDVFWCDGKKLEVRGSIDIEAAVDDALHCPEQQAVCVKTKGKLNVFKRKSGAGKSSIFESVFSETCASASAVDTSYELVYASQTSVLSTALSNTQTTETLVKLCEPKQTSQESAAVPYGIDCVFTADNGGNVHSRTLAELLAGTAPEQEVPSTDRLDSPVTVLKLVKRSAGDLLVAGDEDGVIRIWTANSFAFQGSWTAFADPVESVSHVDDEHLEEMQDVLLCTSKDGTVAIISLHDMDLLYLIPASRAPLRRVFLDSKNVLLAYANGKARVWNYLTGEFRRSTGLEAGEDMLASGEWVEVPLHLDSSEGPIQPGSSSIILSSDLGRMTSLDLRAVGKWAHSVRLSSSPLPALRAALSMLLTYGLDQTIDDICQKKLEIEKPDRFISVGEHSMFADSFECFAKDNDGIVIGRLSGLRQVAIVTLLRPFLDSPEYEKHAAQVIAFYSHSHSSDEAGLEFFTEYYTDPASDVQQAAKILSKAKIDAMSEEDIGTLVAAHQSNLPSNLSGKAQSGPSAIKALTIIGVIAHERYTSVAPSALKAAADSIFLSLSKPTSPLLPLSIELVQSAFQTWQAFLDPMDLLRLLFHLATHTPPSPAISAQARLAVLRIADLFPGLFMSTLSMDILDAKTVEGRTSIMKLCVFMARKKPGVIQNGLPRICESVVKSLDPNIGKMREDVWEAATVILNELVLAFSTIDFHSGTQRLAVGTHEGAVIMYDLKTASRLYVLEPHHVAVSSVNFSPDGRRLITVSLEEGNVSVWKVGSSLSGFFTVGGPPRQGAGKGEPFKRIEFIRADNGPLPETSALSDVKVEWPGPRQVRVMIKETALTFET